MLRAVAIVLFSAAMLFNRSVAQEPQSETRSAVRVNQELLETAHRILEELPADTKRDVLSDLVSVGSKAEHPDTDKWVTELEALVREDNDDCRQARFEAKIIQSVSLHDPAAALARIVAVGPGCPEPIAAVASSVFLAVVQRYGDARNDELIAAASHLGSLGSFPFAALSVLSQRLKPDDPGSPRVFLTAVEEYKNANKLNWREHRSFLYIIEHSASSVSRQNQIDALTLAVNRIADSANDSGLVQLGVSSDSSRIQTGTERDEVLRRVLALAQSIDAGLAKKILEKWPDVRSKPNAAAENKPFVGIMTGRNAQLSKSSELFLEVERLKPRLATIQESELQSTAISAPTRVALLSVQASELCGKDAGGGSSSLGSAVENLKKIKDGIEVVIAAPYVVRAAVQCAHPEIASASAELQFDRALSVLRELQKDKPTVLTQTPIYSPLRETVSALHDPVLGMTCINEVADAELKSRLLIELANSLVSRPIASAKPTAKQ